MNNTEVIINHVTYEVHRHYSGEKTALEIIKENLMLEKAPNPVFDKPVRDGV